MTLHLPIIVGANTLNGDDPEHPMADVPWVDNYELSRSEFGESYTGDGITIVTALPRVQGKTVTKYRGTGIKLIESEGAILYCSSWQNYIGAILPSSDTEIACCRLYDNRDVNLWIAAGVGSSNCYSTNVHNYGAQISVYNEGSGIWRSLNDTYADSYIGYFGDIKVNGSHQAAFTNSFFQHNTIRDAVCLGTSNHFVNCIINISKDTNERNGLEIEGVITRFTVPTNEGNRKVGLELAERCSFRSGVIESTNYIHDAHTPSGEPVEFVWVLGGLIVIETLMVDGQAISGTVAIRIKGACESCKIDVTTYGFHQANSKVLVLDSPSYCKGFDVVYRITGNTGGKSLANYFSIGTGWKGKMLFLDTYNSVKLEYIDGVLQA